MFEIPPPEIRHLGNFCKSLLDSSAEERRSSGDERKKRKMEMENRKKKEKEKRKKKRKEEKGEREENVGDRIGVVSHANVFFRVIWKAELQNLNFSLHLAT